MAVYLGDYLIGCPSMEKPALGMFCEVDYSIRRCSASALLLSKRACSAYCLIMIGNSVRLENVASELDSEEPQLKTATMLAPSP